MKRLSQALARFIQRRPWLFIIIAIILSAGAIPGVFMLETETGFEAFVSSDSKIAQDNSRYEAQFGGEPITILLTGKLDDIFSTSNLAILTDFEEKFAGDERFRAINGPLAPLQIALEEANQARQTYTEQPGLNGEPALDNPLFIESVIYNAEGAISQIMRPFVPDDEHAIIMVAPRGNMSDEALLQAVEDIEAFLKERGHDISRSSVGRYGKTFLNRVRKLRIVEDKARAIMSEPGGDNLALEETASKLFTESIVDLLLDERLDVKSIPRIISDFAKLQTSSVLRERMKADFQKRAAQTADAVHSLVKKKGLTDKAAAEIRRKILGIAK